ncbi:MAG TPA: adenylate/guanylate cyclase domain-containing protein, partial [Roseiflexaceae bacterium]|nr:adenylate/guanylate cyclase domain-containing protein [Roseiflexaceae bacterium]
MSGLFSTYVPQDRRQALARGQDLPDRMWGAALFADISGFTPLAESLSLALGPQLGAEELTGLLNRVFGALITEVERYGGSVIGFAGDAITCWFDDRSGEFAALRGALDSPDTQHATPHTPHWAATLRAAACGLAMQCAMAPFAEVAIRQGVAARLAVKVAVAAGPARRFLVGDPQRGLLEVLAGSTLDRLAAAERLALRGEVVLEAESANGLAGCLDIAGWREAGGVRVAVVGGLRSAVRPDPWPALADADLPPELARRWIALAVAERIEASGHLLAQLRPAVALFLQFGEIDYDGDDRAGPLLDAYVRDVQSVVAHFGGCLVQLTIGDKGSYAYAVFGAPHAHDDNAARAVEAALALRASPPHAPIRTVRIGVAQGWMYAGSYGG